VALFKKEGVCLWLILIALIAIGDPVAAQDNQSGGQQAQQQQIIIPPRPAGPRPAERYEIDAKRMGTDLNSNDALPRSREFQRIDSTYYVGWLYEGAYKYNHAADYMGYRNAAAPLERALNVMERDYKRDLATRSPELMVYYPVFSRHRDYGIIAYYLNQCYLNSEQPEKSYALLRRYNKWRFQRDFFDGYNYLMWLVHRNRFYTSEKYPFLKNSIDANEQLANAYLDTALRRIEINKRLNQHIFQPGYERDEKLGVYHYKSMLYSYAFKIDSAAYYFGLLKNSSFFPHNNYATFNMICGNFREAEREYQIASGTDAADKRLQEWAYYSSILQVYKGMPKSGELLMKDMIMAAGSTPGFGWYNIALARSLFYDGQVGESERYIDKAAEFKELHIGTTLGQSHYDFSIQLNKLLTKNSRYEMKRFENRNWWYNPQVLTNMAALKGERYLQEFLIVNLFAKNPERDRVIYKLFSTESTVSWDEVWYLIQNLGTQFFMKRFEEEAANDPRKNIRKYFRLFVARLKIQNGDYKEAKNILTSLLNDPTIDPEYEKLFMARLYQANAMVAAEMDQEEEASNWLNRMYHLYPQLVPFTGQQMTMRLQVSGTPDDEVVKRLKACNIKWNEADMSAPRVYVSFSKKGDLKMVNYYVVDAAGNYRVPKQSFSYKNGASGGLALAYRIFGVGGTAGKRGE